MEEDCDETPCLTAKELEERADKICPVCATPEDIRIMQKEIANLGAQLRKLQEGHNCIQRDRLIQLENRQDKHTENIREDIKDLSVSVRSVIERLEKKKEQNGQTKQEIDHIHQEESDLSKEVLLIKDKLQDHEKIINAVDGLNERLIKQEERHQALVDLIKGKDEKKKEDQGFWENRKRTIFQIILIIAAFTSILYAALKDFLHW
jgi:uncharacterized membrane protein